MSDRECHKARMEKTTWEKLVEDGKDCWGFIPKEVAAVTGWTCADPAGSRYSDNKEILCIRWLDGTHGTIALSPEAAYDIVVHLLHLAKKHKPIYDRAIDYDCPVCGRCCDCVDESQPNPDGE